MGFSIGDAASDLFCFTQLLKEALCPETSLHCRKMLRNYIRCAAELKSEKYPFQKQHLDDFGVGCAMIQS